MILQELELKHSLGDLQKRWNRLLEIVIQTMQKRATPVMPTKGLLKLCNHRQLASTIRMVVECLLIILLNLPWFRHAYLRYCRTTARAMQSIGLFFPTTLLSLLSLRSLYIRFCGTAALYVQSLGSLPPNMYVNILNDYLSS